MTDLYMDAHLLRDEPEQSNMSKPEPALTEGAPVTTPTGELGTVLKIYPTQHEAVVKFQDGTQQQFHLTELRRQHKPEPYRYERKHPLPETRWKPLPGSQEAAQRKALQRLIYAAQLMLLGDADDLDFASAARVALQGAVDHALQVVREEKEQ